MLEAEWFCDVCNLTENINENIPPNILISVDEVLDSYRQIRKRAQFIIPGHETQIEKYQTNSFPLIKII